MTAVHELLHDERSTAQALWAVAALVVELDEHGARITDADLLRTMRAGATSEVASPSSENVCGSEPLEEAVLRMAWIKDRLKPLMVIDVVRDGDTVRGRRLDDKGRRLHSFASFRTVCDELEARASERGKRSAVVARLEDERGGGTPAYALMCFLMKGNVFTLWRADGSEWQFSYGVEGVHTLRLARRGVGAVAQACE